MSKVSIQARRWFRLGAHHRLIGVPRLRGGNITGLMQMQFRTGGFGTSPIEGSVLRGSYRGDSCSTENFFTRGARDPLGVKDEWYVRG